jgi:hypothetical protein
VADQRCRDRAEIAPEARQQLHKLGFIADAKISEIQDLVEPSVSTHGASPMSEAFESR